MGSNKKPGIILTYREGCSGSWLAELLTLTDQLPDVHYRQDINGGRVPEQVLHFSGHLDSECVEARKHYNGQYYITCHSTNYALLQELWPATPIIRIVPQTKIINCIAAAFYKLHRRETTVDLAHEYIKQYTLLHTKLDATPSTEAVIDYGALSEWDSLCDVCWDKFGVQLNSIQREFFDNYWSLQINVLDESKVYPGITKTELAHLFSHCDSVFGRAAFIFVYERANGLGEQSRSWTIDDVPDTLDELVGFMHYNIAKNT